MFTNSLSLNRNTVGAICAGAVGLVLISDFLPTAAKITLVATITFLGIKLCEQENPTSRVFVRLQPMEDSPDTRFHRNLHENPEEAAQIVRNHFSQSSIQQWRNLLNPLSIWGNIHESVVFALFECSPPECLFDMVENVGGPITFIEKFLSNLSSEKQIEALQRIEERIPFDQKEFKIGLALLKAILKKEESTVKELIIALPDLSEYQYSRLISKLLANEMLSETVALELIGKSPVNFWTGFGISRFISFCPPTSSNKLLKAIFEKTSHETLQNLGLLEPVLTKMLEGEWQEDEISEFVRKKTGEEWTTFSPREGCSPLGFMIFLSKYIPTCKAIFKQLIQNLTEEQLQTPCMKINVNEGVRATKVSPLIYAAFCCAPEAFFSLINRLPSTAWKIEQGVTLLDFLIGLSSTRSKFLSKKEEHKKFALDLIRSLPIEYLTGLTLEISLRSEEYSITKALLQRGAPFELQSDKETAVTRNPSNGLPQIPRSLLLKILNPISMLRQRKQ